MAQHKNEHAAADDSNWSVAEGEWNGKPMIVSINKGAGHLAGHKNYSHRVGCAVPFRKPDINGLPPLGEFAELATLEHALCRELESNRQCILVLRITTNGMREFVFYAGDPDFVKERCMTVGEEITSHDFQLVIELDPDWTVYRHWTQ